MDYYTFWQELPDDSRGMPAREKYVPFEMAGYGHQRSTGYNSPPVPCARRSIHLQSTIEKALLSELVLNPSLLDYREHYPSYDQERLRKLLSTGKKIPRSEIATIDGVASFGTPDKRVRYVGHTVKAAKALDDDKVWRRVEREREFCLNQGWGWRLFTEKQINPTKVTNAKLLLSWCNTTLVEDRDVRNFADVLGAQVSCRDLRSSLKKASRHVQVQEYLASALFAHAVLRGWLAVDTSKLIGLLEPMQLKASAEA